VRFLNLRNSDSRIILTDKVDVSSWQILAHNQASVITLGVVPRETVSEEVVEEGRASLLAEAISLEETVRLRLADRSSARPPVELSTIEYIGLSHALEGGGPEPSVNVVGLESCLLTSINLLITEPAAGPDLPDTGSLHLPADKVLLGAVLNTDKVHATFSAVVSGGEPIPSGIPQDGLVTVP